MAIWLTVVLMVGLGALALGPGRAFLPGAVAIHAGGAWEWTDEKAARRDGEVQAALRRLAAGR